MARSLKHRLVHRLQIRVVNPLARAAIERGLAPGYALLETVGRRTGQPRRTPVGDGLDRGGATFWLVAEHGERAHYVRNIRADPRVRVKVRGRWRTGTASPLRDDDPVQRQQSLPRLNAAAVRLAGTELLTVRIDLDP